jgi:hypothetical protein
MIITRVWKKEILQRGFPKEIEWIEQGKQILTRKIKYQREEHPLLRRLLMRIKIL